MDEASGAPSPEAPDPRNAPSAHAPRLIREPDPKLHSAVLFGAGAVLLLAVPLLPARARVLVALLVGCSAALTLGVFAVRHALVLRHRVGERGKANRGGINERPGADGRVIFDLPGEGLEPWGSDAWSVLLSTIALSGVAMALETPSVTIFLFLALLILSLGWRLRAARRDFIRIELEREGWAIDALEGGRRVEIRGSGALLPELLPEALLLWADTGRIGTIRWELAPEERAWLAERLLRAAERGGSLAEPGQEVDHAEPDHHREHQEPEQAQ